VRTVGDVDGGEVEVNLVAFFVEDVVLADGGVEEVAEARIALGLWSLSPAPGRGCEGGWELNWSAGQTAGRGGGGGSQPLQVRPAWNPGRSEGQIGGLAGDWVDGAGEVGVDRGDGRLAVQGGGAVGAGGVGVSDAVSRGLSRNLT